MKDGEGIAAGLLILFIVALIFVASTSTGAGVGRNYVAEQHCLSMGYDDGTWDKDNQQIVCQTFELATGE